MATIKQTDKRGGFGTRYYVHPDDESVKVPSVTTFLDIINKPGLPRWSAKVVAEYAVQHKDAWVNLPDRDAVQFLKGRPWAQSDAAADLGTDAHAYAERRINGSDISPYDNATRNVDALLDELSARGMKVIDQEVTCWSDENRYAGTADLLVEMERALWILDWKTSRAVYDDVALQLAGYGWADWCVLNNGARLRLRQDDGSPKFTKAAVLWVPKEGDGRIAPMDIGIDTFMAVRNARKLFGWKEGI